MKYGKKKLFRILSQFLFLIVFFWLLIRTGASSTETFKYTDFFFYMNPFLFVLNFFSTQTITGLFLLSLIPLFLTLIFGRFFCGWICPLGTINHFFSWLFRRKKRKVENVDHKLLKLKYVILTVVLVMALFGTNIGGWFDPFSILTRSTSLVVSPSVNYVLETSLKGGAKEKGVVARGLKPVYEFSKKNILPNKQRKYLQSVFIGIIFLLLIAANFYKRRFFCNYLCPLGALYGIFARFSILNLDVDKGTCKKCNICSNHCTYNGSPYIDYMKSECMVCYNCEDSCPPESIKTDFRLPLRSEIKSVDLGRRRLAGSIISGIFLASLPRFSGTSKSRIHGFERPPGSVKEVDFLEKCIRCGECMQACPTNFIQPAFFETGIDGLWTPVLEPMIGYCEYECNRCTLVCPTNAIEKLLPKEKKKFKIGTAVIDKDRCYTYADGYNCAVCEEHCPVPEKAIRFREVDVWNFEGRLVKVKQIYVVPDLCIGCGICENVCPRSDAPGIINTAEEEQREFEY